jgi:dihydrofolate reductase
MPRKWRGSRDGLCRGFLVPARDALRVTLQGRRTTVVSVATRLIDDHHVAIVPVLLPGGERLFDHLDGGPEGYKCAKMVSSDAVAHVRLVRRDG